MTKNLFLAETRKKFREGNCGRRILFFCLIWEMFPAVDCKSIGVSLKQGGSRSGSIPSSLKSIIHSMSKEFTSKQKGNIGLGAAINYFCSMGYVVSIPLNDSQKYDLIIEIDGILKKISVKTTWQRSRFGVPQVRLTTNGGNRSRHINKPFDKKSCDAVFILIGDGQKYLIPSDKINNSTTLNLGKLYEEFKIGL